MTRTASAHALSHPAPVGSDATVPGVPARVVSLPARQPDRLRIAPDPIALNAQFAGVPTAAMLAAVLASGVLGRVAVVSSFGAESAVLLHLVANAAPETPVLFLDTGRHFPETLTYRDVLVERLDLTLITAAPDPADLAARDDKGLRWSYDPDGCCAIRKVAPLERALAAFDASLTGRKGFQSRTRAGLPLFEADGDTGRIKVNPLAGWDQAALDAYFATHDLPRHPLQAAGYASIGCAPCTSPVRPGEDPRAGRWRGWDKIECGIHVPPPPGCDPAF